jgi:hypothetical protein
MAIKIKGSSVSGRTPLPADLLERQLAVNTADGYLFTKHSDGPVKDIKVKVADLATTVTNGVYTTGGQTIAGVKTFSSSPVVPTPTAGDNSTKVATTAFVTTKVGTLGTMSSQNANAVTISGGTIAGITDLTVADGGTGVSTLSANAVLLGNGTSALQTVAPSTSGNVLTSNGTTWTSAAAATGITITTGSAPYYGARAFVNFNGTSTVTIRASSNVSSITDNGTGDYTVNFTTAMPDINYTTVVSSITMGGTPQVSIASLASYNSTSYGPTSSSVRVIQGGTGNSGGPAEDTAYFNVVIFR